jgi:hypothetical protein
MAIDLVNPGAPLLKLRGVTDVRQPAATTSQKDELGMLGNLLAGSSAPMTQQQKVGRNLSRMFGVDTRSVDEKVASELLALGLTPNSAAGLNKAAQLYSQEGATAKALQSQMQADTKEQEEQNTAAESMNITNLQNSVANQASAAGLSELGEAAKYINDPEELQEIALKIPELSKSDWKAFGGGSTLLYRPSDAAIKDAAGDSKAPRVSASEIFDNYLGKADADEFNQARVNVVGLIQNKLNEVREDGQTGLIYPNELQAIMDDNLAPDTTVKGARQTKIYSPREEKDVWVERYTEGSSAYRDLRNDAQANISLVQTQVRDYGNTLQQAKLALDQVKQGKDAAGFFGYYLSAVPGTDPFEFNKLIETIKANIGFDTLQQMRQNSPTGGALGQVSNQEIGFLQAALANLKPGLSQEDYIRNLGIVIDKYQDIMEKIQEKPNYNVFDEMDSISGFHNEYQTSVYGGAYPRTVTGGEPIPVEPQPLPTDEQSGDIVKDIMGGF